MKTKILTCTITGVIAGILMCAGSIKSNKAEAKQKIISVGTQEIKKIQIVPCAAYDGSIKECKKNIFDKQKKIEALTEEIKNQQGEQAVIFVKFIELLKKKYDEERNSNNIN